MSNSKVKFLNPSVGYLGSTTYKDIDVRPDVTEVVFGDADTSFSCVHFDLRKAKKQFPNVRRLVIRRNVGDLNILNSLFPNVEEVKSENSLYCSGPLLVKYGQYRSTATLLNTFYKSSDFVIDLDNISSISDYAFEGCRSTKVVNTRNIARCTDNAFKGSLFCMKRDWPGGFAMAGTILVAEYNKKAIIPANASYIAKDAFKDCTEELAIGSPFRLDKFSTKYSINLPKRLSIGDVLPKSKDRDLDDVIYTLSFLKGIEEIYISPSNTRFQSIDGILYNKKGDILIYCPRDKTGSVEIPEGVEVIRNRAFCNSNISAVKFPRSLKIIEGGAFSSCARLSDIDFGEGVHLLGDVVGLKKDGAFENCTSLSSVYFPPNITVIGRNSFIGCSSLQHVEFSEGLQAIQSCAFQNDIIDEVSLPASLCFVGEDNFRHASKITTKGYPKGLMQAVIDDDTRHGEKLDSDILSINGVYLPRYMDCRNLRTVSEAFELRELDATFAEKIYEMAQNTVTRQDIAFKYYQSDPENSEFKQYLRRAGKNMAMRYMETGRYEDVIDMSRLGLLTEKTMRDVLDISNAKGATTVSAYIMQALGSEKGNKRSVFRI